MYEVLGSVPGGASPKENNKMMSVVRIFLSIFTEDINRQISKAEQTTDPVAEWLSA